MASRSRNAIVLSIPFAQTDAPLLRVVLVRGEATSELIVVVHHSIGDGMSAMYLVRDLLESMEGHMLEELPPRNAFENLLRGPETVPSNPSLHPWGPRLEIEVERPQKPVRQVFEIDPVELGSILERSREKGTTLQGTLLASLLLSLPQDDLLQCLAPINVRRLISTVTDDFGLYISSGMATLDRGAPKDFWSLARSARQQVIDAFNLSALHARSTALAAVIADKPSPRSVYEKIWRSFGYNAVLTNLGRFPESPRLKRFRVTAVYPILSPELEPVVAVATANQRAYVTFSSPPALAGISSMFFDILRQHTY